MSGGERTLGWQAPDIDDQDLSAFMDGELEGARRREVAEALEASPFLAKRAEALARGDKALAAYADALAAAALPARLCVRRMAAERTAKLRRRLAAAAVLAFVALFSFGSGWVGHGFFHQQTFATRMFIEEAAAAHHVYAVEVRHPVEVGEAERAHMVAWLSKRLTRPVAAPDLTGEGFRLIGGRLLPTRAGGPAAMLMYEDASGGRVTVYAADNRAGGEMAFRYFQPKYANAETVYWLDPKAAFALTGGVGRDTLLRLAEAMLRAMEGA